MKKIIYMGVCQMRTISFLVFLALFFITQISLYAQGAFGFIHFSNHINAPLCNQGTFRVQIHPSYCNWTFTPPTITVAGNGVNLSGDASFQGCNEAFLTSSPLSPTIFSVTDLPPGTYTVTATYDMVFNATPQTVSITEEVIVDYVSTQDYSYYNAYFTGSYVCASGWTNIHITGNMAGNTIIRNSTTNIMIIPPTSSISSSIISLNDIVAGETYYVDFYTYWGCLVKTITLPFNPPTTLSGTATLHSSCDTNTANLVINNIAGGTAGLPYRIYSVDNSGNESLLATTSSFPIVINGVNNLNTVRIRQGVGCKGDIPVVVSYTALPSFSVRGGTYFYCDMRGTYPNQDGVLTIQLEGNYSSGVPYDVWAIASDGSTSATPLLTLVANSMGVLQGRVPVPAMYSCGNAPDPLIPSPACEDLTSRWQVFNVKVNLANQPDCQTAIGKIEQIANESMTVDVSTPPVCLPVGDQVTINLTVRAPYVKNYVDRVFIVEAFFSRPSLANPNTPYLDGRGTPLNEIQSIDAAAVGTVDDVNGVYTFPMTFNFKAPFMITKLAVTHRSADSRQPMGYYASNCYKDPVGVHKMFMPFLPTVQGILQPGCNSTDGFSGRITLDPLVCRIRPSVWEVVGTQNNQTAVYQTFDTQLLANCQLPISVNLPSGSITLAIRHKLTGCILPLNLNGTGGGSISGGGAFHRIIKERLDDCSGYRLTAPAYGGYQWSVMLPNTNHWQILPDTTQTIDITQLGTYGVSVGQITGQPCVGNFVIEPLVIDSLPNVPPLSIQILSYLNCHDVILQASGGFDSYEWFDDANQLIGSQIQQTALYVGNYTVRGIKDGCVREAQYYLSFSQLQLFVSSAPGCSTHTLTAYLGSSQPSGVSYSWSNGATTSSIEVVSGTYSVTVTFGNCVQTSTVVVTPSNFMADVSIQIPSLTLPNVLSASASTFSEQWLRTGSPLIYSASGFGNGQRGIWKPHETYAYVTDRQRATESNGGFAIPKVATDGVFTLSLFNWQHHGALVCPAWLKTQQVTQYNPFNFEIENKDILDRYTSALYGYKNQLPIATAGNARVDEIAFESFEEYPQSAIYADNVLSTDNNLDLVTYSTGNNTVPSYQLLLVELGVPKTTMTEHIAYVKGKVLTTTSFPIDNVFVKGYRLDPNNPGMFIWRVRVLSSSPVGNMTKLVLVSVDGDAPTCYWNGELGISKNERLAVTINAIATLQDEQKHTGKKSLKLDKNGNTVLFQMTPKRFHTIKDKKYVFSTWVKLANACSLQEFKVQTPSAPTKEELAIATKQSVEQLTTPSCQSSYPARRSDYVNKVYFTFSGNLSTTPPIPPIPFPAGNLVYSEVIEGWVRIEQEFVATGEEVEITAYHHNDTFDILFIDDIRIHPFNSSMQTYVYDTKNYKLRATLDGNNFSSLYFYDEQGNLYLTKKETERGIQTIQEALSHQPKK
jgi:hypothetical protein